MIFKADTNSCRQRATPHKNSKLLPNKNIFNRWMGAEGISSSSSPSSSSDNRSRAGTRRDVAGESSQLLHVTWIECHHMQLKQKMKYKKHVVASPFLPLSLSSFNLSSFFFLLISHLPPFTTSLSHLLGNCLLSPPLFFFLDLVLLSFLVLCWAH